MGVGPALQCSGVFDDKTFKRSGVLLAIMAMTGSVSVSGRQLWDVWTAIDIHWFRLSV